MDAPCCWCAHAKCSCRSCCPGNSRNAAIHGALDYEATGAATDDLAWTRRENGDPVANCGHFGGTVLVKTWDGEQTDDTGSQD